MSSQFLEKGSTHLSKDGDSVAATAVEAHDETTRDDHDVSFPEPAETHQQPSN